jgi:hypothetical protein
MGTGWISLLIRRHRAVGRAVILCLLLPVLCDLFPPSGAAAAQSALLRDLGISICSASGQAVPSGDSPGSGQDHQVHCVLCVAGTPNLAPAGLRNDGIIAQTEDGLFAGPEIALTSRPPGHFIPAHDSPPRGPPAASQRKAA